MDQGWTGYQDHPGHPSLPQDHGFHPSQYSKQYEPAPAHRYDPYASSYHQPGSHSPPPHHYNSVSHQAGTSLWQANQHNLHASTSSAYYQPAPTPAPAPIAPIADVLSRSAGQSQLDQHWQDAGNTIGDALHNLTSGADHGVGSSHELPWSSYAERVQAFDDQAAAASQVSKTKPFIAKLVHLLSNPDSYADCITWDDSGTVFIVSHANPRLLQVVLPRMFQHANIQSFTRQLNVYDFRRLPLPEVLSKLDLKNSGLPHPASGDYSGWSHPTFSRDNMGMLEEMTPRPSKARLQKKLDKEAKKKQEISAR